MHRIPLLPSLQLSLILQNKCMCGTEITGFSLKVMGTEMEVNDNEKIVCWSSKLLRGGILKSAEDKMEMLKIALKNSSENCQL